MRRFIIGRRIPWGNNNPKEINDNNGFEEQTIKMHHCTINIISAENQLLACVGKDFFFLIFFFVRNKSIRIIEKGYLNQPELQIKSLVEHLPSKRKKGRRRLLF